MPFTGERPLVSGSTYRKEEIMRVFVAGASGAIGARLLPQLVERGHEVIGSSRSANKADRLHGLGAEPVVLDLLDPRAVREAVVAAPARRDRPPGDRARRPERLQALRPHLRANKPPPDRGHGRAACRRARGR